MRWISMAMALGAVVSLNAHAAEFQLAAGGQVDAGGHGVLNFTVRDETWQVAMYTDTLDVRWTPSGDHGKAWLGFRGAAAAAGLMISPWTNGRADPDRALLSRYGGLEFGAQRFLGHGLYSGVEGSARMYGFGALDTTIVPIPQGRPVVHVDTVFGWYRSVASAKIRPGVDVAPDSLVAVLQPHLVFEAAVDPGWMVSPHVEVRAGVAEGQDSVTLTRLGGLNPYVVPLAGAAWAEWWVEDYAALRTGPSLTTGPVNMGLYSDLVWFDGQTELGFAAASRVQHKRLYGELDLGVAPWIARPDGDARTSVWFEMGLDWGRLGKDP